MLREVYDTWPLPRPAANGGGKRPFSSSPKKDGHQTCQPRSPGSQVHGLRYMHVLSEGRLENNASLYRQEIASSLLMEKTKATQNEKSSEFKC